jgi:hypothetical protein
MVGGVDGTRTPSAKPPECLENKANRASAGGGIESPPEPLATSRAPLATSAVADDGPTDAALERAIVAAVTGGAFDVARTLAAQLDERRKARARNVVDLATRRR